jgi:hypothetical protein
MRQVPSSSVQARLVWHQLPACSADYLKSNGTLEHAQQMANHSPPRTTRLYNRSNDDASLDEYEKVGT